MTTTTPASVPYTPEHAACVAAANRALRFTMRAHKPNRAKPWQSQVQLTTEPDACGWCVRVMLFGPHYEGEGGYLAAVTRAADWREAIELAVAETLDH